MNTCGISPCTVMWFSKLGNLHILSLYISQPQKGSCYHFRNSPLQRYHLTTSYLLISGFLKLIEIIKGSYQTTLLIPSRKNMKKILCRYLGNIGKKVEKKDNALHRQVTAWEIIFPYDELWVILWIKSVCVDQHQKKQKFQNKRF